MKRFLIGSNWKMHKTLKEAQNYLREVGLLAEKYPQYQIFMIPPFTHLHMAKDILKEMDILLGAQNMHWEEEGNYTGEISPVWLQEIGVQIALLGHSERRKYYGENDRDLARKVVSALEHQMTALLCVGEQAEDKQLGVTAEVIRRQIRIGLSGISPQQASQIWIAYEPAWAIGPQGTCAPVDYVGEVHDTIRAQLVELFKEVGKKIPILYGGSVNAQNCAELSNCRNVDGLFVGRAAWEISSFKQILSRSHPF